MADVNRGNRPLSPHLQVYRPQITSVLSILHRATGVALTVSVVLLVGWLFALAMGEEHFECFDGFMTSWFGILVLLGSSWAVSYHFCNGIRHLWWDMGKGLDIDAAARSGWMAVIGSFVLTAILWLYALV